MDSDNNLDSWYFDQELILNKISPFIEQYRQFPYLERAKCRDPRKWTLAREKINQSIYIFLPVCLRKLSIFKSLKDTYRIMWFVWKLDIPVYIHPIY